MSKWVLSPGLVLSTSCDQNEKGGGGGAHVYQQGSFAFWFYIMLSRKNDQGCIDRGSYGRKNYNKQERYSETVIKSQFEPQTSFMLNSGC